MAIKKILIIGTVSALAIAAAIFAFYSTKSKIGPKTTVPGKLEVILKSPEGAAVPISTEGITVMFNEPMVALGEIGEGKNIDIQITPSTDGSISWLGTTGFIFKPEKPFNLAENYKVIIPKGLVSLKGNVLSEPVEWEFSTTAPRVLSWKPEALYGEGTSPILPLKDSYVSVTFNISMNKEDVEKNLAVFDTNTGKKISAKMNFKWADDDHILLIKFKESLPPNSSLEFLLPKGIKGRNGNLGLPEDERKTFNTPENVVSIRKITYDDEDMLKTGGKKEVAAGGSVCYSFSQPISNSSFEKAFQMEPGNNSPQFYYSEWLSAETIDDNDKIKQVAGYKTGCVDGFKDYDTNYSFHLDLSKVYSIYGVPVEGNNIKYLLHTSHAKPALASLLGNNIFSYNGQLKIPYKSINVEKILVNIYKIKNNRDYSEYIKNERVELQGSQRGNIFVPKKPFVSESLSGSSLVLPIDSEWLKKGKVIDQNRMKSDATLEITPASELDKYEKSLIDLKELPSEQKLSPGIYLIEASGKPASGANTTVEPVYSMIQITPVGLMLKRDADHVTLWTTDIETGKPLADISVQLYNFERNWDNENGGYKENLISNPSASTNSDGVVIFSGNFSGEKQICAEVLTTGMESYSCRDMHDLDKEYKEILSQDPHYFIYTYTDRPIYRPGQTVYYSSIVRRVKEGRYFTAGADTKLGVEIKDSESNVIYENKNIKTEVGGIFKGEIKLEASDDLPRGIYSINISAGEQKFQRRFYVTSYKKPSFKVELKKGEDLVNGDKLEAEVKASYFFGAPLRKAKVDWSIMTSTYVFSPENYEQYSFIDDDLLFIKQNDDGDRELMEEVVYISGYEYDIVDSSKMREDAAYQVDDPKKVDGDINKSNVSFLNEDTEFVPARLDDNGNFKIEYLPLLNKYPVSQILSVEASVLDLSNQKVSASEDIIVHKADFYLGLNSDKWVYGEGEEASVQVVSLDPKGKVVAGKNFTADIFKREYNYSERRDIGGKWDFNFEKKDTKITTIKGKTLENGKAVVAFKIPTGGTYRIVVRGKDEKNNEARSALTLYSWGEGYVPWKVDSPQSIELVPDKTSYKVGETARILLKSMVPMTKALMTLERGRVLEYKVIELGGGNAEHIEVPIKEGMIPNIYVDITAHTGRSADHPPMLFSGSTELNVEPESKRLNVIISTDKEGENGDSALYKPREKVTVNIETKDINNLPHKSHVIVSVADESVLSLLNYKTPDLVKKFYFRRPNSVSTSSSLISLKAGDGGQLSKKRRIFKDTAHFEGNLQTDEQGKASFAFTLPDDLTTWSIEAVAVTESKSYDAFEEERKSLIPQTDSGEVLLGTNLYMSDDTFVGSNRVLITTSLPVILRSALPRFVAWGDEIKGNVIINNRKPTPADGDIFVKVSDNTDPQKYLFEDKIKFNLSALSEAKYPINFKVENYVKNITVLAEAKTTNGSYIDGFEVKLPVLDRYIYKIAATSGTTENKAEELVSVESEALEDKGGLNVSFKSQLGSAVLPQLEGLADFPWSCSEQKSASLIAMLIAKEMGLKYGDKINTLIKTLGEKFQKTDGGMGYWPESGVSSYYASVQVLWAFSFAKKSNVAIDNNVYMHLKQYVYENMTRLSLPEDMKIYGIWAESLDERDDFGYAPNLRKELAKIMFDKLSISGTAYYLYAAKILGETSLAAMAEKKLKTLASFDSRHVSWPGSDFFWSSSMKNTSLAALALFINNKEDPLVPKAISYIFNRKTSKSGILTQDSLYISALAYEYSNVLNESESSFNAKLELGNKLAAEKEFDNKNTMDIYEKHIPMKDLKNISSPVNALITKNGEGHLYYDLVLKYYLPPDKVQTEENGMILTRNYYDLNDFEEKKPLTEFKAGEAYKAHIVLVIPHELNYVLVQDLLPAGFEPIDMTLKTSSRALLLQSRSEKKEKDEDNIRSDQGYADVFLPEDYGTDYAFSHQEIRDDSIVWSDEIIPPGVYHIRYPVMATTAGKYIMSGAEAFEFYEPEISGRSRAQMVEIK